MKALFARKDLRLLFGGQTVSMFGDWMMIIVLGIWAKTLTGSSSQAGLVFLVLGVTGPRCAARRPRRRPAAEAAAHDRDAARRSRA